VTIIEARDVALSFGPTPPCAAPASPSRPARFLARDGPSGSGKSTLLHCLAGILVARRGRGPLRRRRVDTLGETGARALRRDRFGFVFQFASWCPS